MHVFVKKIFNYDAHISMTYILIHFDIKFLFLSYVNIIHIIQIQIYK